MSRRLILTTCLSVLASLLIYNHQDINGLVRDVGGQIISLATSGRVNLTEDSVLINNHQEIINISSQIPDGFPSNLPIFPGARLDLGISQITEDSISVNFVSSAPLKDVSFFYLHWLPQRGWKIKELPSSNHHQNLLIKGRLWRGNIWLTEDNKTTQIAIDLYRR